MRRLGAPRAATRVRWPTRSPTGARSRRCRGRSTKPDAGAGTSRSSALPPGNRRNTPCCGGAPVGGRMRRGARPVALDGVSTAVNSVRAQPVAPAGGRGSEQARRRDPSGIAGVRADARFDRPEIVDTVGGQPGSSREVDGDAEVVGDLTQATADVALVPEPELPAVAEAGGRASRRRATRCRRMPPRSRRPGRAADAGQPLPARPERARAGQPGQLVKAPPAPGTTARSPGRGCAEGSASAPRS